MARARRSSTWSDAEVEGLYDVDTMLPETAAKARHLLQVMKAIRRCNRALTLDEAIEEVVESACSILECDRATLFMVDAAREQLVLRRAVGVDDMRLPLDGSSIAGSVCSSGETLNITDAYADERFNSSTDAASGYRTQSLLCAPVLDASGEPVAVLQAVNKLGRAPQFDRADELLLEHLSLQLGVVLRNQLLREESARAHERVLSLLDLVRALHSGRGANSLLFTVAERAPALADAERCTLYVVDHRRAELWTLQGALEIRAPLSKGLVGHVASTGRGVNVADAHQDPRFNTEFDRKTGFRTRAVLALPIRAPADANASARAAGAGAGREVVGVLQLINKLHAPRFTEADEQLLGTVLDVIGSLLAASQLFRPGGMRGADAAVSEFGAAQDLDMTMSKAQSASSPASPPQAPRRAPSNASLASVPAAIAEEDDE